MNGWKTNEEPVYKYWHEAAKQALQQEDGNKDKAVIVLADQISEELEEGAPDVGPSVYSDLMIHALQQVDYYEVATAFLEIG